MIRRKLASGVSFHFVWDQESRRPRAACMLTARGSGDSTAPRWSAAKRVNAGFRALDWAQERPLYHP